MFCRVINFTDSIYNIFTKNQYLYISKLKSEISITNGFYFFSVKSNCSARVCYHLVIKFHYFYVFLIHLLRCENVIRKFVVELNICLELQNINFLFHNVCGHFVKNLNNNDDDDELSNSNEIQFDWSTQYVLSTKRNENIQNYDLQIRYLLYYNLYIDFIAKCTTDTTLLHTQISTPNGG